MSARRLVIGIGILLAVIAPLVIASAVGMVVADFMKIHADLGWTDASRPALTVWVFEGEATIRAGLFLCALIFLGTWLYIATKHRQQLLISTLLITIGSLQISLVTLMSLLMAVWLPVVARVTMIGS